MDHYDVIIIGSGAGGGTLAHHLAPSGLRILILERGDFLPRERENWDPVEVHERKRYLAPETWFDKDDRPFTPYTHYWVGGNTKVYGAALLRMREDDFGEVRHYGGVSPAWPIGYDELESYYAKAERLYSVHGQRGSDPHEPRASGPYPYPALKHEPRMQELYDDLTALGHRPFPVPLGLKPEAGVARGGRGEAPQRLGWFDGYPDPTERKADAHVCAVKPALEHENVTLLTRARVERLETDAQGGRVARVIVARDGERLAVRANVVVLACGAINSAALLLRSASDRHRTGLANSSGMVGRHYMCHHNGLFIAVMDEPNPSAFQKTFGMTEFYRRGPGSDLPLGTIQLMGKPDRGTLEWLRGDALPGVPLGDIAGRTVDFFLTAEDLPSTENRVTLRDDGAIRLAYTPTNMEAYRRLESALASILARVEMARGRNRPVFLMQPLGISGVSHQSGTLRFGSDAATSVLDVQCKAHDLENLYAVDASFFPSSSAVNPSLTIMANAMRVGDHLLELMGASREVRPNATVRVNKEVAA